MHLLEELRAEHLVIERTLGALRAYVAARLGGTGDPADGAAFLRFFRLYAGRYHHAREEDTLFPALLAHLPIRPDSGPVRSLLDQHASMARTLDDLGPLLSAPSLGAVGRERLAELSNRYAWDLLAHIDAENSVLLPESEARLLRGRASSSWPAAGPTRRSAQPSSIPSVLRHSTRPWRTPVSSAGRAASSAPRTASRARASSASGGPNRSGTTSGSVRARGPYGGHCALRWALLASGA